MAGTAAGKLINRIQFQRPTIARGASGTKKTTGWSSLGYDRAMVLFGTGAERREAGVEQASQAATFRCRAHTLTRSVTAKDRIVFNGLNWDIVAIAPLPLAPAEIEFTAVASRG